MKVGSLFAGIGGFDLGLERAGMTIVWQVEIDAFVRSILAKHWPEVPKYEDVRAVGAHNLEPVDVIAGGFPCQPHSVAGKRRGAKDDRDLWPEMRRIIEEMRPRWVVAENVPGIRTTILDDVLSDLEGLGYSAGAIVVPACAVGAPHIRERVFIVAHANSNGRDGQSVSDVQKGRRGESSDTHTGRIRKTFSDAYGFGCPGWKGLPEAAREAWHVSVERDNAWTVEPDVGRVAYGVPHRVDRIRALGNAVVPQIVEVLGRFIIAIDKRISGRKDDGDE